MSQLRAFRFPESLDIEFAAEVARRKITMTDAVVEALRLWLDSRGQPFEPLTSPPRPRLSATVVAPTKRRRTTVASPIRALELQVGPTESGPGSRLKKR